MKLLLVTVFLFGISFTFVFGQISQAQQENSSKKEAERLWELAIQAKGGREQINRVQNILVTTTYSVKKYGLIGLYELPDKWWRFANDPEPLGKQVVMNNLAKNLFYLSVENEPRSAIKMRKTGDVELTDVQLYFLLETKFVKPLPFETTIERINGKNADIVKTNVDGKRVDFVLVRKTHLPIKIAFVGDSGRWSYSVNFSDYIILNSIQIPTKVGYDSDYKSLTNIKFNVDYDKTLFENPPRVEAGINAWMPKVK